MQLLRALTHLKLPHAIYTYVYQILPYWIYNTIVYDIICRYTVLQFNRYAKQYGVFYHGCFCPACLENLCWDIPWSMHLLYVFCNKLNYFINTQNQIVNWIETNLTLLSCICAIESQEIHWGNRRLWMFEFHPLFSFIRLWLVMSNVRYVQGIYPDMCDRGLSNLYTQRIIFMISRARNSKVKLENGKQKLLPFFEPGFGIFHHLSYFVVFGFSFRSDDMLVVLTCFFRYKFLVVILFYRVVHNLSSLKLEIDSKNFKNSLFLF